MAKNSELVRRLDDLKRRALAKSGGGVRFSPEGLRGEDLREWIEQQRAKGLYPVERDELHEGI